MCIFLDAFYVFDVFTSCIIYIYIAHAFISASEQANVNTKELFPEC